MGAIAGRHSDCGHESHGGKIRVHHLNGKLAEEIVVKNLNLGDALDWAADGRGLFMDNSTPRGVALTYLDVHGKTHAIWEQQGLVEPHGGESVFGIARRAASSD